MKNKKESGIIEFRNDLILIIFIGFLNIGFVFILTFLSGQANNQYNITKTTCWNETTIKFYDSHTRKETNLTINKTELVYLNIELLLYRAIQTVSLSDGFIYGSDDGTDFSIFYEDKDKVIYKIILRLKGKTYETKQICNQTEVGEIILNHQRINMSIVEKCSIVVMGSHTTKVNDDNGNEYLAEINISEEGKAITIQNLFMVVEFQNNSNIESITIGNTTIQANECSNLYYFEPVVISKKDITKEWLDEQLINGFCVCLWDCQTPSRDCPICHNYYCGENLGYKVSKK